MAHFYACIKGSRGPATRTGGKSSGIGGHIRGWSVGGVVICHYDEEAGEDKVSFYLTSGSNRRKEKRLIGTFTAKDLDGVKV